MNIPFRILFACTIIYFSWEGMLLSALAVDSLEYPFYDYKSLLKDTNYIIAVYPGGFTEDAFKYSSDPIFKEAWTERIEPYLEEYKNYIPPKSNEKWIRVLNHTSKIALFTDTTMVMQTEQYASCKIIATPMQGDRKPSAFGFQKDSPYLDLFNFYLKEMQEKGAIGEILKDIMPQNCRNYSL